MAEADTILFVDDEINVLKAVSRVFADEDLHLLTATSAEEALQIIGREPVAVLVSDNRMPGMSGIDLLKQVKQLSPTTVRIMMTGYVELATAIEAINIGEVFRFVVKPWENETLIKTVREGVARHQVVQSLRRGDEAMIRSIAQAIELKDASTRGHCDRVADYALLIAAALGLPAAMQEAIKQGSWLHDCGKIGVPETILNFTGRLNEREFETIRKHPFWGAEVARQANLSPVVINIIHYHHEHFDGRGYPAGKSGAGIPLEARIVAVADVYDALTSDRPYHKAYSWRKGLEILVSLKENHLDPELVEIFRDMILAAGGPRRMAREVSA